MRTGRRLRRGQAANPGTGRTPIVPLLGLAPGGVWPPLRHRRQPDALTVRFHPCPPGVGHRSGPVERTVCFCATFRPRPGKIPTGAWELPSTLSSGARTFLLPGPLGRRSPSPHESTPKTVASPWLEGQVGGGQGQGNRILIFKSILIYQHFHPEPLAHHPEPVEGLHPLPLILSLSKDCTPYTSSCTPYTSS